MNNLGRIALVFVFSFNLLSSQYNPDNHVITFSKYYLKHLQDVEGGTSDERNKIFEEEAKKMDPLNKVLISKLVLGHRWTGSGNEVVQMAEWKSIADADKSILGTADRRKKAWPDEEKRKAFLGSFNKYWKGKHTDLAIMEQVNSRVKRYKGNSDEFSVVTVVERYLRPISEVENGSIDEREELLTEHFNKVIMKNEKILSRRELRHYWSGSLGGGSIPIVFVTEFATMLDADNLTLNRPYNEKAWPDEEERQAFFDKLGKYFAPGHKDIAVHTNWVKLAKR